MDMIYPKILEQLENNRVAVMATLVKKSGSAPRDVGTKFLILEDGSPVGTIGGGLLEAQVMEAAKKVLDSGSPLRVSYFLAGTDVEETDMICGGDADVFLEPLHPGNPLHMEIYTLVLEIHRRGGSALMATILNREQWTEGMVPKVMITPKGEQIGAFPEHETVLTALVEQFDDIMEKQRPDIITYTDSEGRETDVLAEPVFADPALYIFGGGHVSTEIVPLAARAGFKVVVIDDREEYAAPDRFPQAAKVQCRPFAGVLKKLDIDQTSYIVIVTRGHMHDKTILEQSLKTDAKYIGMIGSRRKRDMIYDKLLEEGFTQDDLDRVCSPIGLDIGAETPEEIAVSIAAELIKVRAGRG